MDYPFAIAWLNSFEGLVALVKVAKVQEMKVPVPVSGMIGGGQEDKTSGTKKKQREPKKVVDQRQAKSRNTGSRPSNDESPSRKKQRWCYDEYMHEPVKKLSRILEAAKKEFGKKAPKTEGEIIIYAQRWAAHKNLPIPRRN